MTDSINKRKAEHIQITLNEKVTGNEITTGLERVHFIHNALPEINFPDIAIESKFVGQTRPTPFMISSMTGGAAFAETINRNLAIAAEEKGWIFALGSMRALIESDEHRASFQVREYAPSVPIIANLGAVQLNYGFGVDKCRQIIEMSDANMLVLHLNSIQEVIQPNGDLNFKDLLVKIEELTRTLAVPVGVKEVGWGIDGHTARKLCDVGVSFIDVAGAGGTSWSQVEKYRSNDPVKRVAAETFSVWGNPTVDCIVSVREEIGNESIVASGGMYTGLDAAKSIALGADVVGFGRSILKEATQSVEDVIQVMETKELELRLAMFGVGAATLPELQASDRVRYTKI
ncbi:type 2 isopentenyl-diphosphate Delta-isomerase [Sporosarcina thermotolerans]|uniref:Isopentenyl-diphosphate delta-isomerase n=1 Tax=Sporosarcina thermotolerans TaxID=633404 RepID=A0AAW9A755_9BACL|nr:type 2 isopentenyl-diphosphate Delta-isomerase [Sporosarcina thermotolerans]MDW0115461.1 type 2 isopentenyl-diphosphate Delta-isomerase [Sporosarcina thermotolerans]